MTGEEMDLPTQSRRDRLRKNSKPEVVGADPTGRVGREGGGVLDRRVRVNKRRIVKVKDCKKNK